jgi:hypothetical protein
VLGEEPISGDPERRAASSARDLLPGALTRRDMEAERCQLVKDLIDLYQELDVIQGEIQKIRSDMQETQQILDGHWIFTIMPAGTKGDVFLSQNGTLVTGDYTMENGQAGSLQGTFVNNVLVLEKIDQKFGKNGRIEGAMTKDRRTVRGSWFSYEFSSGQPLTGAFSLDRVQEETGQ